MGLSISLSNALSGMNTSQGSLDVLSRNVANAGTPGYHRQSLSVVDIYGVNSTYAQSGGVQRAFNESLQAYYTRAVSDSGFSSVRADVLDRLQTFVGKPGDPGGLDSAFSDLENALQQLATSPDNYAARATVVARAQDMAGTLNALTSQIQGLRQETEAKIGSDVDVLNQSLSSLGKINARLADQTGDPTSRAALMDQRDRLVEQISEIVDVRADYRTDGTVGLMTRSGVGLLDDRPSTFEFQSGGTLSPQTATGKLVLHTSAGITIDLVQQNVLKSGELAGLVELRDRTLPAAQSQLDDIAAGLAQAFSTVTTEGAAVTSGGADGFSLDLSGIRDGNDVLLRYTENGADKSLRLVRVDDASKLPLDYLDANGARVLGVDFSGGAGAVAAALGAALGSGFAVSGSGSTLQVLDDGAANTTSIASLTARATATGLQNGDLGLSLFVDAGNADYTASLGGGGQKLGFAGRIAVNSAIVTDNTLLVRYQAGGTLGDAARADYLVGQLGDMRFASPQTGAQSGGPRLGGTVADLIAQTMDYQGSIAANALGDKDTQQLTMDALNSRMDSEYGVNVDDEMARLMELQNAYAANARVIAVVQDLLNRLMEL
jgi:flagellar hook-associated protein 1 FlgK